MSNMPRVAPGGLSATESHKQKDVLNKFLGKMCSSFKGATGEVWKGKKKKKTSLDSSLLKMCAGRLLEIAPWYFIWPNSRWD